MDHRSPHLQLLELPLHSSPLIAILLAQFESSFKVGSGCLIVTDHELPLPPPVAHLGTFSPRSTLEAEGVITERHDLAVTSETKEEIVHSVSDRSELGGTATLAM